MDFARTFGITSVFVFLSLFFAAPDRGRGVTPPENWKGKDGVGLMNKSPCFEDDVYACRASGGTFNWSHCTCE